ncbi:acyl-CoA dehydrogenase family protein, partial [Raoultella ornithinolytica]|uniref:acyl-CoA dehydrogenase family protein n=1 Tax=Raoultella ornithinolytica TaxID=54291 RepID=UPI0013DCCEE7
MNIHAGSSMLSLTDADQEIRNAVFKLCERFPDGYWLERESDGVYPLEFHKAVAEMGWLGIGMPQEYGGAG